MLTRFPDDWRDWPFPDLEREYSPSSCIGGNYQPYIDAYRRDSQRAIATSKARKAQWLQLSYGNHASQSLSVCLPAEQKKPCPILVFIHGGYWQELSAADSLFAADACLTQGLAFAAIDYTLAPKASIDAIVSECAAALAALRSNATELCVDTAAIVIAGSSAGAHLAAMLGTQDTHSSNRIWPPLRGLALASGIFFLEPLLGTSINAALGMSKEQADRNSPALGDLSDFPPSVIFWGQNETESFKLQSQHFAQLLAKAGRACTSFEVAERNHFDVISDCANVQSFAFKSILRLFHDF